MSRKRSSKRKHPKPKAILRLPDLDQAKSAVLNSLTSADASEGTGTRLMNSWNGTARSLGSLSAGLLSSGIGFISNLNTSPQGQSICAWVPCAAWPMRLPIVASVALIWLQASDE